MSVLRFIARLDIKGENLIKGIQLEGVQVIGDPREYAERYYAQGMDELLLIDAVASLYGRNNLMDLITYSAQNIFVPITVGGGLRSVEDVQAALTAGADKTAINTAAVATPSLITEIAHNFGSQCMVLQIDAKRKETGGWEAYVDGGREKTNLDAIEWAKRGVELGAGEILLTSVDQEGTRTGFDIELYEEMLDAVSVPVIASGGMGQHAHLFDLTRQAAVDGVAMANILHVQNDSIRNIKMEAKEFGIQVRII